MLGASPIPRGGGSSRPLSFGTSPTPFSMESGKSSLSCHIRVSGSTIRRRWSFAGETRTRDVRSERVFEGMPLRLSGGRRGYRRNGGMALPPFVTRHGGQLRWRNSGSLFQIFAKEFSGGGDVNSQAHRGSTYRPIWTRAGTRSPSTPTATGRSPGGPSSGHRLSVSAWRRRRVAVARRALVSDDHRNPARRRLLQDGWRSAHAVGPADRQARGVRGAAARRIYARSAPSALAARRATTPGRK